MVVIQNVLEIIRFYKLYHL